MKYKEVDDIFFFQSFNNDDKLDWVTFNRDIELMKKYYYVISKLGFFIVKTHAISITKIIQKLVESNEYIDLSINLRR